jgi:hypothetical protein
MLITLVGRRAFHVVGSITYNLPDNDSIVSFAECSSAPPSKRTLSETTIAARPCISK